MREPLKVSRFTLKEETTGTLSARHIDAASQTPPVTGRMLGIVPGGRLAVNPAFVPRAMEWYDGLFCGTAASPYPTETALAAEALRFPLARS
jgi:hypothetical protein